MFLNQLSDNEKEAFLGLCVLASNSNGDFADEEKAMLAEYCKEMGIDSFNVNTIKPIEEIISIFSNATHTNKKIALLEILGLLYSDGSYDENEKSFVSENAAKIGLNPSEVASISDVVKEYIEVLTKVAKVIGE